MKSTLEHLKDQWDKHNVAEVNNPGYDRDRFAQVIRSRVKKHKGTIMRYFWGAFTFHLIVYAFIAHVVIRYSGDPTVLIASLLALSVTIPFTVVMMQRFRKMASTRVNAADAASVLTYAQNQYALLNSFFSFKNRYEWVLIPLQCAIGVFITFRIFLPGGVQEHPVGAIITFVLTVGSCVWAILAENKKNFREPLEDLRELLNDYKSGT